jgi:hypothetical protein
MLKRGIQAYPTYNCRDIDTRNKRSRENAEVRVEAAQFE